MKPSTITNQVAQIVLASAALGANVAANAVTWPSTPLGATTNATPMTMLVMSKDHKLFYEAYNDASDVDGDGTLDVRFNPKIKYYGLFDADYCYSYSNNRFIPGGTTDELGKCSGGAKWSGRWLNYMTTARIDALRKVLYGGHREVDTEDQTILRRAYIPQDAHSWGKEYHSEETDGYNIRDYTDLNLPNSGTRHFFGNLTANAGKSCTDLDNCSEDLQPLLRIRTNVGNGYRIWQWASKERPVLDDKLATTGGDIKFPANTGPSNYVVRVEVCTSKYHNGCKQYGNGKYKPTGLLHDYGENESMYFGLLSGSYDNPMSGGRLRKVISSFAKEVDTTTGQFTANATIVKNLNSIRIRDFNNNRTDNSYRSGWVTTRPMNEGEFVDWGNPIGEMLYEATRYFAGKKSATNAFFSNGTTRDDQVGLTNATWDDPFAESSEASADFCARANFLIISDVYPSFDSDQLPGSFFGSLSSDLTGLNVQTEAGAITTFESNITGLRFIGRSGALDDRAPTAKQVSSLATIRGLAPEEPTKEGSYYSSAVARYARTTDLRADLTGKQTVESYVVALSSPLPKIEIKTSNNRFVTIVPFAKSVSGEGISASKSSFQPTNQIVDFYVEKIANSGHADSDNTVNGGRYYAEFQINFEDVEQGADHDMDAVAKYVIRENASNQIEVTVTPTYEAGGIGHSMGYVISGTTRDGVYLVAKDNSGTPAYFLNVPAGGSPGDCDVTPMPASCGSIPSVGSPATGIPTFTFNPSANAAATILKDPLWYAAKHGGFKDLNKNDTLDLDTEWDENGDGVPDTYFYVQNPLRLKESLKKAFDNIIERSGSGGNVVANSTNLSTETYVYQGIFNSEKWSGDLVAYQVTDEGVAETPSWRASEKIPLAANRKIFFGSIANNGALSGKTFSWNNFNNTQQADWFNNSQDILNYLRGVRTKEISNGGTLRDRNPANVLGDIAHSSPFFVKDSNTVFIGANDGMLHAFDGTTGVEKFAYIPSAVLSRLKNISQPGFNQSHEFFVDGDMAVSDKSQTAGKNYLVAALGRGGKGLFGLDVTNPATFSGSNVTWEYFPTNDSDLGHMLGRPIIAQLQNNTWAVLIGNGYNSTSQKAVLYVFNLATGALIRKIDTGEAGDNGLATPGLILDSNGKVTTAYAGDLKGNVWKFDLSSSTPTEWTIALGGQPLFTATTAGGDLQPITAPINLTQKKDPEYTDDPHVGRWFVHFGTGSDFQTSDPANTDLQSWYGLIDTGTAILRSDLLQTPAIVSTGTVSGRPVRTFKEISADTMKTKKGWVMDLTETGERMVTGSRYYKLAEPTLVASSVIPVEDACEPGGRGYLNAVNPFTGGRLSNPFYDINNDGSFDAGDTLNDVYPSSIDLGIGKPGEPVLIGNRLVVGGSEGKVKDIRVNSGGSTATTGGRISWREIVR